MFPFLGHCAYWNLLKSAIDVWTRAVRITVVSVVALPLGISMVAMGGHSLKVISYCWILQEQSCPDFQSLPS